MITYGPITVAAHRRFRQRFYHDADGGVRTVRTDGQAVLLTARQFERLRHAHEGRMVPLDRDLRWSFNLSIPVILLGLGVTHATGLGKWIDRIAFPPLTVATIMLVLTWWPLWALYRHHRGRAEVDAAIEAALVDLPLAPVPPPRSRAFDRLEIVALFLVGPGLLLDIAVTLWPHAFEATPFGGRRVDWRTYAGFAIAAVLLARHWHRTRSADRPQPA